MRRAGKISGMPVNLFSYDIRNKYLIVLTDILFKSSFGQFNQAIRIHENFHVVYCNLEITKIKRKSLPKQSLSKPGNRSQQDGRRALRCHPILIISTTYEQLPDAIYCFYCKQKTSLFTREVVYIPWNKVDSYPYILGYAATLTTSLKPLILSVPGYIVYQKANPYRTWIGVYSYLSAKWLWKTGRWMDIKLGLVRL